MRGHDNAVVLDRIGFDNPIIMFNGAALFERRLVAVAGLAKALEDISKERFASNNVPRKDVVNMFSRAYVSAREACLAQGLDAQLSPPNASPCRRVVSFVCCPCRHRILAPMQQTKAVEPRSLLFAVKLCAHRIARQSRQRRCPSPRLPRLPC